MTATGAATTEVDVVIVGGGVAGLHAAKLIRASASGTTSPPTVVVLEGRDRIGGRLHSPTVGGAATDLGATWFWENEPLVTALIEREGLASFHQHIAGDMMFQPSDRAQRIDGNQMASPALRLLDGTQAIATALAAHLPPGCLQLDTPVREITSAADGRLMVRAGDACWRCEQLIIALPPATAIGAIEFADVLESPIVDLASATPVWMGATCKIVARFDHAFWRDEGLAGSAFSHVGPMREIHDMSGPSGADAALFGFAQPAAGTSTPSPDEALEQFVAIFGPAAAAATHVVVHDWRRETLTSPVNVEALAAYDTFGHSAYQEAHVGGRLHWASTETARHAPGHIEGALWASSRAAQAVLTSLAPTK